MNILNKIIISTAIAASALTPAFAKTSALYVNVPFSFTVANQQMAAGRYEISMDDNRGVLFIEGAGRTVIVLSSPLGDIKPDTKPSVLFRSGQNGETMVSVKSDLLNRSIVSQPVVERSLTAGR